MKDLSYLTNHYDEKIKKINEINAPLNFIFITDQHHRLNELSAPYSDIRKPTDFELTTDAIESMKYILERCPGISMVISGGDIGNDYAHTPEEVRKSFHEVMDALYSLPVPVHACIGNHDDAITSPSMNGWDNTRFAILPDELHELCMKNNPTPENYYYIDVENTDYRFVFLNTSDIPYYKDENGQYALYNRTEISNKQAMWLRDEALKTDRKIVVFSHAPISNKGIFGSEGAPDYICPFESLLNGPRVHHYLKECKNVMALFAGHVHFDNLLYDDDILSVTTLSAFADYYWSEACTKREFHTITETAFDVVSIKDDMVYMTRFGAGNDRLGCLLRYKK